MRTALAIRRVHSGSPATFVAAPPRAAGDDGFRCRPRMDGGGFGRRLIGRAAAEAGRRPAERPGGLA